ncbi:MAG: hypothetical protein J6D00_03925 [Christensenellaceae bacterium]|nr:hypothetical protein [Christensenellaceae bacterium]
MSKISKLSLLQNRQGEIALAIYADNGQTGSGAFREPSAAEAMLYLPEIAKTLHGKDALSYEQNLLSVKNLRLEKNINLPMGMLSAIDSALLELSAKGLSLPVYQLLGGKVREKISFAAEESFILENGIESGIAIVRLFGGAYYGREGMKKNLQQIEEAASKLPKKVRILLDCHQGWDSEYMVRMVREFKNYNIRYKKLPLAGAGYETMRRYRDLLNPNGIMLSPTETAYTLYSARELISRRCADQIRCDIHSCGGIAELKKIAAYAQANGVMLIPVGADHVTLHFAASSLVSPFIELTETPEEAFFGRGRRNGAAFYTEELPGFGKTFPGKAFSQDIKIIFSQ